LIKQDKTIKIWKDMKLIQSIEHPKEVWECRELDNGDLVTGCADKVARIWTREKERFCDEKTLSQFNEKVNLSKKKSDSIDISTLPGPESLEFEGLNDGETKMINRDGRGEYHQWIMKDNKWELVGYIVDQNGNDVKNKSEEGNKVKGVLYDRVFNIAIPGSNEEKRLGYNYGGKNIFQKR
jgi:phospholipase A-2-activating protein